MIFPITVGEVSRIASGSIICGPADVAVKRISTDSRTTEVGDLFAAIKGDNFDGHDFVADALRRGAGAALVCRDTPMPCIGGKALVRVDNTVEALGALARTARKRSHAKFVGITGSNGKTTTKDLAFHVLSGYRKGIRSQASFNNAIGVPLTMFELEPSHEFAIFEVGTNMPGEIANLASMVRPHVAVVTNVSETHLEGFGSPEEVAREKAGLLRSVQPNGKAILNADCPWAEFMMKLANCSPVTFGVSPSSDVKAEDIASKPDGSTFRIGEVGFELPVPGSWNIHNSLAAVAVALQFDVPLRCCAERLASFTLPRMRMEKTEAMGVTFINDAYNANPASMANVIDYLNSVKTDGRKILVCGDMRELGRESAAFHRKLGERILKSAIVLVVGVGDDIKNTVAQVSAAAGRKAFHFRTRDEALPFLQKLLRKGDVVLFKASRKVGLDVLADQLIKTFLMKEQV